MLRTLFRFTLNGMLLLLCFGGCAAKQTPANSPGATVTDDASQPKMKNPNPGPTPSYSLANTDDLWLLLRSGYAIIAVQGSIQNGESNPADSATPLPSELEALQSMVTTQSQSAEVTAVGELLSSEYEILQIVPATSAPIGQLRVAVQITAPDDQAQRHVHIALNFSYQMSSRSGKGTAKMPAGATEEEANASFQAATRDALASAFRALETDPGLIPPL